MPKNKLLFVDDRSKRIHAALAKYGEKYDVTIAPNVKEALRAISEERYSVISLDNDLNGDDYQSLDDKTSGMEIIRYIVSFGYPHQELPPIFIIHSKNSFAARKMQKTLVDAGYAAGWFTFSYDTSKIEWEQ